MFCKHMFATRSRFNHTEEPVKSVSEQSNPDSVNTFVDECRNSNSFINMGTLAGFTGLRAELLVALRKEQPLTATALGARFGLARGVGGPGYEYSLTEQGEQLFPRAYANPLADALDIVRAEQGSEGVVGIFRRRWEAIAEANAPALADLSFSERACSGALRS